MKRKIQYPSIHLDEVVKEKKNKIKQNKKGNIMKRVINVKIVKMRNYKKEIDIDSS